MIGEPSMLNDLLAKTASVLDIPDYVYEDATLKYEDVGAWLGQDDSDLASYLPEIYPQGSFRLGTVVRPVFEADEYDIDLVCHLQLSKLNTTQRELKEIVGDRLKQRPDLARIIRPSRRCWVLDYPGETEMPRFHMDILPAIPNLERPPTGILLTDTGLSLWQKSNPKAYAEWFYDRMKVVFTGQRAALAESAKASVEDVPEWQVKTALQIVVQILKRHRDVFFYNDPENRVASIIITTLAAKSYKNQAEIDEALVDVVNAMPTLIERRAGRWWIANPVDPDENFADRWNDHPERQEAFTRWIRKAQTDFSVIGRYSGLREAIEHLIPVLGERTMTKSAVELGVSLSTASPTAVSARPQPPAIADTGHTQRPPWPMEIQYKTTVSGSIHAKQGTKKLWGLTNRTVPKKVWLRFVAKTNAPPPYEIRWQVVNTGKEAAAAGQLRGDFYTNDVAGRDVRWERTLYRGSHWIEAFVIKNGKCVARSGRKMVIVR